MGLVNKTKLYWKNMTYIETIAGVFIFTFFIAGFSQVMLPAYQSWNTASSNYRIASNIEFISDTFRKESALKNRNIEKWKRDVSIINDLVLYEISEINKNGIVVALKVVCNCNGENFEVIAECAL